MKPSRIRGGSKTAAGQPRVNSPRSLSPTSLEAIGRFVRILARCGATPADIVRAVRTESERIPRGWSARAFTATREIEGAAHVLTVWFGETEYLDPSGKPRALPLEGPSRSFTALVRSVDRRFEVQEVLGYLIRIGAVRRLGRRYAPRARTLYFRGTQGPDYFHTQRVLANVLATLEHNIHLRRAAQGWFEYFAENRQFPVRAREQLDRYVATLGREFLFRLDAYMHRREVTRRKGERTVNVGVGVHLWEGHPKTRRKNAREQALGLKPARRTRHRGPPS